MRRILGHRMVVAAAAIAAMLPHAAGAQTATALRRACQADYARHCTGEDPPSGLERACLAQYYVNLSPACQAAIDAGRAATSDTGGDNAGQ